MVVISTLVKSIKIRVKAAIAKKSENSLKMDLKWLINDIHLNKR